MSEWGGEWRAMTFWNKATGSEQVALVKGVIDPDKPTLLRMHSLSPFADLFGEGGRRGGSVTTDRAGSVLTWECRGERQFGGTARLTRARGNDTGGFSFVTGLRLWF